MSNIHLNISSTAEVVLPPSFSHGALASVLRHLGKGPNKLINSVGLLKAEKSYQVLHKIQCQYRESTDF